MGFVYRIKQFWQLANAKPLPDEVKGEIAVILTPAENELFYRYSYGDQWHTYNVLKTLESVGQTDPAMQTAALLHDIGKTDVKLTLWDRTLIVLASAFVPDKVDEWGDGSLDGWKRPFIVKKKHAEWSANLTRAIGTDPLAVKLMHHHQDKLPIDDTILSDLLTQFQWADDQN